MSFSQSCVCTIFILINNYVHMQNELTFASTFAEISFVHRNNILLNFFLFISSTMSNTCSLLQFGVQIVSDWSFLQILGKDHIGNLVGHD